MKSKLVFAGLCSLYASVGFAQGSDLSGAKKLGQLAIQQVYDIGYDGDTPDSEPTNYDSGSGCYEMQALSAQVASAGQTLAGLFGADDSTVVAIKQINSCPSTSSCTEYLGGDTNVSKADIDGVDANCVNRALKLASQLVGKHP